MSQKFVKGRTNNHLTWVMVDATDFATPESALSAATKIKIYGKLRGATGTNFVSSGTGSLTNDITHVGASALGIYTIALAKADLSDASAAWYDQYIISLSATGAAYQTLVVDGGIDASALSAYQSRLSDIASQLTVIQSIASDAHSAALLGASAASDAHSAVIIVQSRLSDLDSRLASDLSDVISGITALSDAVSNAHSAATLGASRALVIQSRLSDLDSRLASDLSDVLSQLTVVQSMASDAASAAAQGNSRVLLVQSRLSDLDSRLASDLSDALSGTRSLRSALIGHEGSTASATGNASTLDIDGIDHDDQFNGYWVKVLNGSQADELRLIVDTDATNSRLTVKPAFKSAVASGVDFVIVAGSPYLSNVHSDIQSRVSDVGSDLRSYLVGLSGIVSDAHSAAILAASHASDAHSTAALAASRALINQSRISDVQSYLVALSDQLSDAHSDLKSAIGAITVTIDASAASDIASAVWAHAVGTRVDSRVLVTQSLASDAHSAATLAASRVLLVQSRLSDLDSRLVSDFSDLRSYLSDIHSDLKSAIGNVSVTITASDISDIASAVAAAVGSNISDIYSLLSDLNSNFLSRIPKEPAARSQLSDMDSNLLSYLAGLSGAVSDAHSAAALAASHSSDAHSAALLVQSRLSDLDSRLVSDLSDVLSAAQQANSRVLVNQSRVSDIYSLLSDLESNFGSRVPKEVAARSQLSDLASDAVSDLKSFIGAGVPLDASSLSDLRSAIDAAGLDASDISDVASRVAAVLASDLSDIHSAATAAASRALVNQSRVSDIYSLLSDLHSDVAVMSGVQSDIYSALAAGVNLSASDLSDIRSAITANGMQAAGGDPAAVIGVTASYGAKLDWMAAMSRNKLTQTSTKQTVYADNGTTVVASATVSDDGTTATRGEFA